MEKIIKGQTFDAERALYGSDGVVLENCRFDGPADGESALKECKNVEVKNSFFNLRYPLWHNDEVKVSDSEMTENCRAALWYTTNICIADTKLHGIKALRECAHIRMKNCDVDSTEFGWFVKDIAMKNTAVKSEYFMMRSEHLDFCNVSLKGKYSFQYITDSKLEHCDLDTKDAFWHAKNVIIRNSVVKGEYLAWYCENVTFENCTIIGTQPLCYCKNLKLVNCEMIDTDLAFEKSEVEATICTPMISIKNPRKGTIVVPQVDEIIMDDDAAEGKIMVNKNFSH